MPTNSIISSGGSNSSSPTLSLRRGGGSPSSSSSSCISGNSSDEERTQQGKLMTSSNSGDCAHCLRKGAPIFCHSCGFFMINGRVAKPCSLHPKVIYYTDFKVCPKCKKTGYLRELD